MRRELGPNLKNFLVLKQLSHHFISSSLRTSRKWMLRGYWREERLLINYGRVESVSLSQREVLLSADQSETRPLVPRTLSPLVHSLAHLLAAHFVHSGRRLQLVLAIARAELSLVFDAGERSDRTSFAPKTETLPLVPFARVLRVARGRGDRCRNTQRHRHQCESRFRRHNRSRHYSNSNSDQEWMKDLGIRVKYFEIWDVGAEMDVIFVIFASSSCEWKKVEYLK